MHLAGELYFSGPPDIAVEVVSPSSRQYDTVEKNINYARYGVGEYWLIDPVEERAVFYRQVEGHLLPIPAEEGLVRSQLLDGYWLRLEWLFPPEGVARPSVIEIAHLQGVV
jgi:Uma2 family endonuclease